MLRRQPLITQLDPALISSGVMRDRHALQQPLWQQAANVRFYDGKVKRRLPNAIIFGAGSAPIRGLSQLQTSDGTRWIWVACGGAVKRWYGPAPEDIISELNWTEHETSSRPASFYDFTHYGNWTIINHRDMGGPRIFRPGMGIASYLNAPADAMTFRKLYNFVLAIGCGQQGKTVSWCDADAIEVWGATATNLAGSLPLEQLDTRIVSATSLGQYIACYAEDQLALISYIGAPFVFSGRVVLDGIGAVGKFATCSDGKMNYGVGRNGCWRTDGNSVSYIDEGSMRDYFQEQVNWNQKSKVQVARNDVTGCIDFHFPMRGSLENNEAWSFDPRMGGWSTVQPVSVQDERRLFSKGLVGSDGGTVYLAEALDSGPFPLSLKTKPLIMASQRAGITLHMGARVDEVDLLLKDEMAIEFRVGSSESIDILDWTPWIPVQSNVQIYQFEALPTGVYYALEFRSTAENWRMDLQGFMLYGELEGTKRAGGL